MKMETGEAAAGFAARLRQVIRDYRNASQLAKAIGRSEGALRNWITRRSQPVVDDIVRICAVTDTRVEWLMIGRGVRKESEALQLRESAAGYARGIDESLFEAIAEAIERELIAQSGTLSPKKKAGVMLESYNFIGTMAAFNRQTVARLVKLAL